MYLEVIEYRSLSLQSADDYTDEELEHLIEHAEYLLDIQTRYFYHTHSFDSDCTRRKMAVKRAIVSQVDYYIESGFTSVYGLKNDVTSISLGRTTISGGQSGGGSNFTNLTGLCPEFWQLLQGTGLLWRGV